MRRFCTSVGSTWFTLKPRQQEVRMAPIIEVTREELLARRQQILNRLGLTLEEYLQRGRESAFSGDEWDVRDDMDSIAFLLDEREFVD